MIAQYMIHWLSIYRIQSVTLKTQLELFAMLRAYDIIACCWALELSLKFCKHLRRVLWLLKSREVLLYPEITASVRLVFSKVAFWEFSVDYNITTMADKENLGRTTATDVIESDTDHDLHFARRGEALAEASSSQDSIDGYDPESMSGRTLLTAEEEKKLLRKIDWRLMTLCSLMFMFKNLDSNNVRVLGTPISSDADQLTSVQGIQCSNYEQGNRPEHHDPARNDI